LKVAILNQDVFALHVTDISQPSSERLGGRIGDMRGWTLSCRQKSYTWNFLWLLRIGPIKQGDKHSRDEPKKPCINGRAYLWAMDMPQSKRNENQYFAADEGQGSGKSTRGVSDLIRRAGSASELDDYSTRFSDQSLSLTPIRHLK